MLNLTKSEQFASNFNLEEKITFENEATEIDIQDFANAYINTLRTDF